MTNYIIGSGTCTVISYLEDTIEIAFPTLDVLDDNEQIEYVSDVLIHEHMHKVLYDTFGLTTARLYDAIEQHFLNQQLDKKYVSGCSCAITYEKLINRDGFDIFLYHKHLVKSDVTKAFVLCNTRQKEV